MNESVWFCEMDWCSPSFLSDVSEIHREEGKNSIVNMNEEKGEYFRHGLVSSLLFSITGDLQQMQV